MNEKRKQRVGRPSSFSVIPVQFNPFVTTAVDWVLDNQLTQIDALEWLSGKLRENGFPADKIPTLSSFNRHVMRVHGRRQREADRKALLPELARHSATAIVVKALRDLANAIEDAGPHLNDEMRFEIRFVGPNADT